MTSVKRIMTSIFLKNSCRPVMWAAGKSAYESLSTFSGAPNGTLWLLRCHQTGKWLADWDLIDDNSDPALVMTSNRSRALCFESEAVAISRTRHLTAEFPNLYLEPFTY